MDTREEYPSVSGPSLDSGGPQELVVCREALGAEFYSELVEAAATDGPVYFNSSAKVMPLGSMAQSIQRVGLTDVQKDRGMTMTSNGQVVKLSHTEQMKWSKFWKQPWRHKAAILWSKLTSVDDRFTGHVFESRFGEAVHPSAPLYRMWNTFHKILMLYPTMVAPLTISFHVEDGLHMLGTFVGSALLFDVLVTFFVAFKDGKTSDHLERNPLSVADHYIKSWLLFDVITSLPWQALLPYILSGTSLAWVTDTNTVREGLDFLQIARYATIIRRDSYNIAYFQNIQYKQRSVLSFVFIVLVASHWMSCLWMLMARTYLEWFAFIDEDAFEKTWLSSAGLDLDNDSLQSQYIRSLYFSITIMATIGYGDITPQNGFERTLCIMAMILGTWAYAYCITQLVEMVAHWQSSEVRFKAHQDDLIEYMRARSLPEGVQKRILKFYDFQRQHAAVFYKEHEILERLTPNLRAEVTHFAHRDTVRLLKGLKLFETLEENLLTRLIVALTTEFMPPDELVIAEGELGEKLYIIRKGVVSVIKNGVQQALLTDGQSFGETVLYSKDTKRTATVVTRSYCQLMLLSKQAVQTALETRPQQYEALQAKAKVLYQAHISRDHRWQADVGNDSNFALLRTSMSLSRDLRIEGQELSSSQPGGEGPVDVPEGEGIHSLESCPPSILARPTYDRPITFD